MDPRTSHNPNTGRLADSNLAVLVLTPDAAELRLTNHILELVTRRLNARIVGAIPHRYSPYDVLTTYRGRTTHPREETMSRGSSIASDFFAHGPSLIVFLARNDRAVQSDFQSDVASLKGSSGFKTAYPGSIRALSPLCDRCLSLVHSPDSTPDLDFELALVLSINRGNIPAEQEGIRPDLPGRLFEPPKLEDEYHPLSPLVRMIEVSAMMVLLDPRSNEPSKQSCSLVLDRIEISRAELVGLPPVIGWRKLRTFCDELGAISRAVLDADRLRLFDLLARVCDPSKVLSSDIDALLDQMSRGGLQVGKWDAHRLKILYQFHAQQTM